MKPRLYLVSLVLSLALAAHATPCAAGPLFHRAAKVKPHPTYSAVVAEVSDGDTLYLVKPNGQKTKARLHAVDCPEVAHNSKEKDQPYGQEAKAKTTRLAAGKKVSVEVVGKYPWPPFDDVVEIVLPDRTNLGDALINGGFAQVDPRYRPSQVRLDEQKAAKADGKGLWADKNAISPWQWRKDGDAKK